MYAIGHLGSDSFQIALASFPDFFSKLNHSPGEGHIEVHSQVLFLFRYRICRIWINGYWLRLGRKTGSLCREMVTLSQQHYILSSLAQLLVKRRWAPLDALKSVLTQFTVLLSGNPFPILASSLVF